VSSAEEANAQLPGPPVASGEDGGAADMAERSEDLPRQVHLPSKATAAIIHRTPPP
jgi:hypothetical protein